MSTPGIAEEITLDSGEAEVANITPSKDNLKHTTLEIAQLNKLHKTQKHIRVFDHKTLYIKEKTGKQARYILLDLSLIDENPVRVRHFNMTALITGITTGLLALTAVYIQLKGLLNVPSLYMYLAAGLLLITSGVFVVMTAKSLKDTFVFKTAHGKVPFLFLFNNAAEKASFKQFIKAFVNNINLARANNKDSKSNLLAAIVGEHRRLFEKGFITESQFESAKKNILSS